MAKANVPLLALGNRGIISPKALARVDLDRTRMSAEVFTNWVGKSQGALTLRPGTKFLGSSKNDTGAEFIEFVASTNDVALPELTHNKMRIWLTSDTGNTWENPAWGSRGSMEVPLARPLVSTTVSLTDTGWENTSAGGAIATVATDLIPAMTGATTDGVTITASSENAAASQDGWRVGDNNNLFMWFDTGAGNPAPLPSWVNVDFGIDTGNRKAVTEYSIRAGNTQITNAPNTWRFLTGNFDTGTYAIDTGKWTLEDARAGESLWASSERRNYRLPGADTGTIEQRRHWRLYVTLHNAAADPLVIAEMELFDAAAAQQVKLAGGRRVFNATSIGALARSRKQVVVTDTGIEHSLDIMVERGPLTLRVGSSEGDDDYVNETQIGTGHHNLAFVPQGNFHITLQSDALVDRIVSSLSIGDSGTVEITTHVDADHLSGVRYDQSADVVYVDCNGLEPHKIERRGTGRSWSFVELNPTNGPFLPAATSSAKLRIGSLTERNTTLVSDVPFFKATHADGPGSSLFRIFNEGQSGVWRLGALDATTDPIEVTGLSDTGDTGTPSQGSERRISVDVSGVYSGRIQLERSFDGEESGFHPVSISGGYIKGGTTADDTGTFSRVINDPDDNARVWYRARLSSYTSGVAEVRLTYAHGGIHGICRVVAYNTNQSVDVEVLSRFSDTGFTDSWQEGRWSGAQQYPSAVALHGGRLYHAGGANLDGSVSDDYENYDLGTIGDAAPISRTLGSGPVDSINYLLSLLRLIIGTAGAEIELRSSSLDEPVTPTNSSARQFSTQGSANIRAVKMDTNLVAVQRSGQRVFMIGPSAEDYGGYTNTELTMLVPDLLEAGVVSIAIQRQPDTRVHCVLSDGTVGILTYEPQEEVLCWKKWETDGAVEKAVVLPGAGEDKVYYHIRRTINGATKRYLERWAMESECLGDTGLSWLADCAASYTDAARTAFIHAVVPHLATKSVIVWGDDTGQSRPGKDYSPDVAGVQTTYTADTGGDVTLTGTDTIHHAVVGLPYRGDWKSTKLAYAAEAGTALGQMKRVDKVAFILHKTHNNGLFFGTDTGRLDALPRVIDGAAVDPRHIFDSFDKAAIPLPGGWDSDTRLHLRAKAPRPCTILAAVPTVATSEKV